MSALSGRIRKAKDGKGLWLFIDKGGSKASPFDLPLAPEELGDVAYAIREEEVEVIRDACNEYLESKNE